MFFLEKTLERQCRLFDSFSRFDWKQWNQIESNNATIYFAKFDSVFPIEFA